MRRFFGWCVFSCFTCGVAAGGFGPASVVYVDDDASGGGNGRTWATAYRHLADALTDAALPGSKIREIRVGQGVYRPDETTAAPQGSGDPFASFEIPDRVRVLGGYRGLDAAPGEDPLQRDPGGFPTVLSGDLNGDDVYIDRFNYFNTAENSAVVVYAGSAGPFTLLSGLTIESGVTPALDPNQPTTLPDWYGDTLDEPGGIAIEGGSPVLQYLNVRLCKAAGGAIRAQGAMPFIEGSRFEANASGGGGAILILNSDVTISGCVFVENTAPGLGGAIAAYESNVFIADSEFHNGDAALFAGGAIAANATPLLIERCRFQDNSANRYGGAIVTDADITCIDSTFAGNVAAPEFSFGGAVAVRNFSVGVPVAASFERCMFQNNGAVVGGGAVFTSADVRLRFVDCDFRENLTSSIGGAAGVLSWWDADFLRCVFVDNEAEFAAAAISQVSGDMRVVDCVFVGNLVRNGWGAAIAQSNGPSQIRSLFVANSVFSQNSATLFGSAIGLRADRSQPVRIVNCTILDNLAPAGAGAIYNDGAALTVENSILWNPASIEIDGNATVSFSDVRGGWIGSGNIDLDPAFDTVDAAPVAFRLRADSPCIDAGSTQLIALDVLDSDADLDVSEPMPGDIDGLLRRADRVASHDGSAGDAPVVDMGASEYQCPGDVDGSGAIDLADLAHLLANFGSESVGYARGDVTRDGVVDLTDLATLLATFGLTCE